MEAILARTPAAQLETAAAQWMRATRRLAHSAFLAAGAALVKSSRAGLLVSAGVRPRRRF